MLFNHITVYVNFGYRLELKKKTFSKIKQTSDTLHILLLSRCKQASNKDPGLTFKYRDCNTAQL